MENFLNYIVRESTNEPLMLDGIAGYVVPVFNDKDEIINAVFVNEKGDKTPVAKGDVDLKIILDKKAFNEARRKFNRKFTTIERLKRIHAERREVRKELAALDDYVKLLERRVSR